MACKYLVILFSVAWNLEIHELQFNNSIIILYLGSIRYKVGGEHIDCFFIPENSCNAHPFSYENLSVEFPKVSSVCKWN